MDNIIQETSVKTKVISEEEQNITFRLKVTKIFFFLE